MTPSMAPLPSYTQPDPPEIPSYTAQPRGGEQTLSQGRPRRAVRDWTVRTAAATLTLVNQPVDAQLPTYGRETEVAGSITLHSTEAVVSVKLKLHGYVKCKTIAEIGSSELVVLDECVVLWQVTDGSSCPTVLLFKILLPSKYRQDGETGFLPPTFEYTFYDVQAGTPGLKAKIKYQILLDIEHSHSTLKDKLGHGLSTQFVYLPRTRPAVLPASVPSSVFEAIMEHRVGTSKEQSPIAWKLSLPPPGTYPLTKAIPFRVSVTSRTSSLIAPFSPTNKRDKALIRVYILRKISIRVNGVDLWRSYVIGEGNLSYVPPSLEGLWLRNIMTKGSIKSSSSSNDSIDEGWARHDWEGEVKVDSGVTVGGFKVGDMTVKDFMVLSVVPPNPRLGDLLEVKRTVPIQLTTDECISDFTLLPPLSPLLPPQPQTQGRGENLQNGNGAYHNGVQ